MGNIDGVEEQGSEALVSMLGGISHEHGVNGKVNRLLTASSLEPAWAFRSFSVHMVLSVTTHIASLSHS